MRTDEEKEMLKYNEHTQTLKAATEVYRAPAEFVDRIITPTIFNPSVYSMQGDK